jgi:hypothetical protein
MRRTLRLLVCGALVIAWTGLARSGENGDAAAIVAKAIQAAGGEANLARHNAATWKETGTYYGMGDGLPYTGKYAAQLPGQFRMEIEGVFTLVVNGDKGWVQTGGETKEMSENELALQQHNHRAGWIAHLVPLKDKAFTLKVLPPDKVDDRPVVAVQVTRKDYPEVKLYFDKANHMLVKSEFRTKSPEQKFKEVTAAYYYSGHREIDGAKVPTRLVVKHDGKVYVEADIQDMKAAGKLADAVFGRP